MIEEKPYYAWTIVEAWDWLINLPVLGSALLVLLGIFVLVCVLRWGYRL